MLLAVLLGMGSSAAWAEVSAGDTFTRISSILELSDGDEVIFVNQAETYACGTTQNSNNRTPVSITVNDHSYTYVATDNVQVFVVRINPGEINAPDLYGFHTGSGYIYSASGSSNYLRTNSIAASNVPVDESAWSLSIDNNVITATNSKNTSYYLAFNGTLYFSQYKSGQSKPYIFKKVVAPASPLASIALSGTYPTTFHKGDDFSHEGMTVTATYEDESTKDVTSKATFSGYDMSETGERTVTVSYTESEVTKTATYNITVNAPATLTSISLSGDYQTEFTEGDEFNHDNLVVTANYSDETTKDVTDDAEFSVPDMTQVGPQTIIVSYNDVSTTYEITVNALPTYTVTFADDSSSKTQASYGAEVTLPTRSTISSYTFAGWSETNVAEETTTAPTIIPAGGYTPTANITLYPVYSKTEGGGGTQEKTASVTIGDYASTNGWSNSTQYETATLDVNVTATAEGGGNTGKFYSSNNSWRLYANESAKLIISTTSGELTSVTITYTGNKLTYGGTDANSGTAVSVSGSSATFAVSGSSSNTQVTAISVDYTIAGGGTTYYWSSPVAAAVERPTINVAANPFLFSTTATITCETDGAAIKYSYDNENWNDYSEALTITATTTLYAKAVKDETESSVASVTATKNLAVPIVTIDATGITNTNVFDGTEAGSLAAAVTYNDAAVEGATVTWSGDNDEVATIDASTGAVTLVAAGTVTFTATYAGNSDYSEKTATYEMTVTNTDPNAPGTENNPYSVAQALAADPATGVYVRGTISAITEVSTSYHNATYTITDGENTMTVYRGRFLNNEDFTSADQISVGDLVVVFGNLSLYNEKNQLSQGNYLVSLTRKADSDFAISSETNVELKITSAELHPTSQITYTSSSTGDVIFVSNDDAVVTVSDEGIITAQGEGTTTITVMQEGDSNYKASAEMTIEVTVSDNRSAVATDIDLPAAQKTLVVGDMDDFTATGTVDAGFTGTVVYTYETSDASIVDVVEGTFSAEAPGTADITITATPTDGNAANYKSASQVVTVTVKGTTTLALSADEDIETFGTPIVFTATIADGYDGVLLTESSNDLVATAAIEGTTITVTSQAVGTAVITVTAPETEVFAGEVSNYFSVEFVQPAASTEAYVAMQTLFDETFNKCDGTGGRDGEYTGNIGTSSTSGKLDESWVTIGSNGASECIKLGTSKAAQNVTTRNINVTGNGTLTFSAAGWGDANNNTLTVSAEGATLSGDTEITLEKETWNSYTVNITEGTGDVAITFTMKRGFLDDVKVTKGGAPLSVTLNASGYATYCSQYPLDFTGDNDYSAWQITGISEDAGNYTIIFSEITDVIAGGQGILLKGLANTTIELASSADNKETLDYNKFVGTIAPAYVESNEFYGLKANNFVHVNAGVVPANKALLPANLIDSSVEVKGFTFVFEDMATGIRTIEKVTPAEAAEIFNLAGQKMNRLQKGINIVNGKKVLVK